MTPHLTNSLSCTNSLDDSTSTQAPEQSEQRNSVTILPLFHCASRTALRPRITSLSQPCLRAARVLAAITADYTGSLLKISGDILAILGGASAALTDATTDTIAKPAGPGRVEAEIEFTRIDPATNTATTLCRNQLSETFPIEPIGGLAITEGKLSTCVAAIGVGLSMEFIGRRISHATRKHAVTQMVQEHLQTYLRDDLPDTSTPNALRPNPSTQSCLKRTSTLCLALLIQAFDTLGQIAEPSGKLLVQAGLGLWILQEGLAYAPYNGLNGLTITDASQQPITIPISTKACLNDDFPDPTAQIDGTAEGYLLFPEVFTQKLSATPIISTLLFSGLGTLLLGKVAHHALQNFKVRRAIASTLSRYTKPNTRRAAETWRSNLTEISNDLLLSLASQGLVARTQLTHVENVIQQTITQHCDVLIRAQPRQIDTTENVDLLNHIETQHPSPLQLVQTSSNGNSTEKTSYRLAGLRQFAKDVMNPTEPLPIRTTSRAINHSIFWADTFSKIGTVAIMASYISRTVSDGIPYFSTGFNGIPAVAENTFSINETTDVQQSLVVSMSGSLHIPQFSLQNFQTSWFIPLIIMGLSTKVFDTALKNQARRNQTKKTLRAFSARWLTQAPTQAHEIEAENKGLTLRLLKEGGINDAAAQGFLIPLTKAPRPFRWFSVKPYESISLERIHQATSQPALHSTNSCLTTARRTTVRSLQKLGHTTNSLMHKIHTVLASSAIGIALMSDIFDSWSEHGKITADDPGGTNLTLSGVISTAYPAAVDSLSGLNNSVTCSDSPISSCNTNFTVNTGFIGEELAEYEIPNPSLITDRMRELGLMIGIPSLIIAVWWGRKLGASDTGHAYKKLRRATQSPNC